MKHIECDLCNSSNYSLIFEAKDYITGTHQVVVRCQNCGLVYINPQPSFDELGNFYPKIYYGEKPFLYEKLDAFTRFRQIKKIIKLGSIILDIGSGRGLLLSQLKRKGCEVIGTELSEMSSKYARGSLNLNIINKNLEDCAFEKKYFDVITMFHSLEHLISPLKTLKEIYRIIKPGGTLVIEVPRFNSIYQRLFKEKWFHLDVPRHLFHFEDQTLEKLLTTAGFSVFKKKRYSIMYDSFGALQSILNYICSEQNLLNDLNTKRIRVKDIIKSGRKKLVMDTAISLVLQSTLYIPLFIFTIILSIVNRGGTLTFYAKKLEQPKTNINLSQ
jgi:2-polyprenyl-3-methyl-5-hydroxy-6-metoxy-1,4-benzoquinol methylase